MLRYMADPPTKEVLLSRERDLLLITAQETQALFARAHL